MSTMPPQRQGQGQGPGRGMSPAQGAQEAERRLGLPCYFAGQKVQGMFGCVACQLQIRPRPGAPLPTCPQCGEMIWAYLEGGERPVPEGEAAPPPRTDEGPEVSVQDGVKLDGPSRPVSVQEGVKLDP